MSPRLQHALRFAVPTFATVLAAGTLWELFEVVVQDDVPAGMSVGAALAFNLEEWALIAAVAMLVVFLLRVADVNVRPPSWGFAWLLAGWVGVACVAVAHAIETDQIKAALGIAVAAIAVWLLLHRHVPGWPGRRGASVDLGIPPRDQDLR